ncbi:MAG: hypothetical protein JNJ98_14470 [Gemmatimonadetes bacterium]|nr:hypothetical protein [Gemmatimonadota bacterium]
MAGRHLPPDPGAGDPNTIGGYMAVHARPAAFEGRDGLSYSVSIEVDATGDEAAPWGAYFLFLRWRRMGSQGIDGHVESEFLEVGAAPDTVRAALAAWSLAGVKRVLDDCIQAAAGDSPTRRWWDVMREDTP